MIIKANFTYYQYLSGSLSVLPFMDWKKLQRSSPHQSMWDLSYISGDVPDEPFNIVINKLCKKIKPEWINNLIPYAN